MKKTIIILGLFTFSLTKITAQTQWAPIGAKWCYEYGDLMLGEYFYMTLQSVKDTIVKNKSCRQIDVYDYYYDSYSHQKSTKYSGFFLMYNDSNKVYYSYKNDKFRLIYDFSLQKGDTLNSYQPIYKYLTPIIYDTVVTFNSYIIDSVNIIQISGKNLKRQYLHLVHSDTSCYTCPIFNKGQLIERLGYNEFIFGEIEHHSDYYGPYFKCYHDNEIDYKKQQSFNCDGFNGIKDNNELKTIKIYPNPTLDFINIDFPLIQNLKMQLFNIVGQCVLQKELNDLTNSIDISSLTKGIYILKIASPNGTVEKKIIKE